MFAFYDDNGYKKNRFPCLLSETGILERYLESKAEAGEILAGFSTYGLSGYFEKGMPKKYHYCIDVYYRPLKRDELETDEFNEYKETCLACGWKYVCAFENIIVFYSEEKERPRELQTDSALKRDILKRITLRTELRQMSLRLAVSFSIIALYALNFHILWSRNLVEDKHWWDVPFYFPWVLVIIVEAWETAAQIRIVLLVWKERPLIRSARLWNRFSITQILICIWAALTASVCFWFRFYFRGVCAVIVLILTAGNRYYELRDCKSKAMDYEIWLTRRKKGNLIAGSVIVFVLLLISLLALPATDRYYRFSIANSAESYRMDYRDSQEKDVAYNSALSQSDAGFLERADDWRVKRNPGHYTEFEQLLYIQDSYPEGVPHTVEQWFYVGTLTARLSNEGKLSAYLKEKHLTLQGAAKQDLVPGVASYLLPSGREMIHIENDMVVIHFLDKRDTRRFSLEEPAVREAVAAKVRAGMELYR